MNFNIILIPIIFICIGIVSIFSAPYLKPNSVIGFRTKASKKNTDSFIYANKHMGIFFIISGILALVLDFICYTFFKTFTRTSFLLPLFAPIISVPFMFYIEFKLKKNF